MQAIIGIMLIANRWIKTAAILMLVLHCGVAAKFGIFPALEYAIIVGIVLFGCSRTGSDGRDAAKAKRMISKPSARVSVPRGSANQTPAQTGAASTF